MSGSCKCTDGFYNSGVFDADNYYCRPCHSNCLTCTSGGATSCLTCSAPLTLAVAGTCKCIADYFDTDSTEALSCSPCDSNCSTCTDAAFNSCLTCKDLNAQATSGTCLCKAQYYDDDSSDHVTCKACHVTCQTCSTAGVENCVTCRDANAELVTSQCTCKAGYYDTTPSVSETLSCVACHSNCSTCTAGTALYCKQCKDLNAGIDSGLVSGECKCNTGYSDIDATVKVNCIQCHSNCNGCTGTGAAQCLSCNDLNASASLGKCTCNQKYYDSDASSVVSCSACHSNCNTCTNSANTNCLTCVDINAELKNGECLCKARYFDNDSSDHVTCQACHVTCQTCSTTGVENCVTCRDANAELVTSQCTCKAGYYDTTPSDSEALSCAACHSNCSTCSAGTAQNCKQCKDLNAGLDSGLAEGECKCSNQFSDADSTEKVRCILCHSNCSDCYGTGAAECRSCSDSNATASSGTCTCHQRYFDSDPSTKVSCLACHANCVTCSGVGASQCLSCTDSNASAVGGDCTCKARYFDQDTSALVACVSCHENCQTCSDAGATSCLTCRDSHSVARSGVCVCNNGYFDQGSSDVVKCVTCPPSCDTCSADGTACLTCKDTFATQTQGVCVCNPGYFDSKPDDDVLCTVCPDSCQTCTTDGTKCVTCKDPNATLNNGVCQCKPGYIDTDPSSSLQCTACHSNCATCSGTGAAECLTCADANAASASGECKCVDGYFDSDVSVKVECEVCHESCRTCNGARPDQCSSCKDSNARNVPDEGCTCKANFYYSKGNCFECATDCKICDHPVKCLTCKDSNAAAVHGVCGCSDGYGVASIDPLVCEGCPEGTYYNRGQCALCHSDCKQCSTKHLCDSCKDPAKVPSELRGCDPVCEQGTYKQVGECLACHVTCIACNSTATDCQDCVANAVMEDGDCVCRDGFQESALGCEQLTVSVSLTVNDENEILIEFSAPLRVNLTEADLAISIEGLTNYTFSLERYSASLWQAVLTHSEAIIEGAQVTVAITNPTVTEPNLLLTSSTSSSLYAEAGTATQIQTTAQAVGSASGATTTTAVSLTAIFGFFSGSTGALWSMINNIQILTFIPMIHIDLPDAVVWLFQSLGNFNPTPNLFEYIPQDDYHPNLPSVRRIGKDSSRFLDNFGNQVTIFLALLLIWPISCLLSNVSYPKVADYFKKVAGDFQWRFFLRFGIQAYLELLFAGVLQLHFISAESFYLIFNAMLSIIAVTFCLLAPIVCGVFIHRNYYRVQDEEFLKRFGSLFTEFKNDKGVISSSFYVVFFIRRVVFLGILFFFQALPLLQIILGILSCVVSLGFTYKFTPITEKYQRYSNNIGEICMTLTFGLCGFYILDLDKLTRTILQWLVIVVVFSMILGNFLMSILSTIKALKMRYQKWRSDFNKVDLSVLDLS